MDDRIDALTRHYEFVLRDRMHGLPIVNPDLEVEGIAFRAHAGDLVGVLLTPWFMNLVLLPGSDEYVRRSPGESVTVATFNESVEFTVASDDATGRYLSAVLFRSVEDFDDQATARAVAEEVIHLLLDEVEDAATVAGAVTRRDLFRAAG